MDIVYRIRAQAVIFEFYKNYCNSNFTFLLPANTCEIIPVTLMKLNIPFITIDINKKTMSMDLDTVEKLLEDSKENIQGIHYVFSYGHEIETEKKRLKEIKEKFGIVIISDKCLCKPDLEYYDNFSDLTVFSTGYSKYTDVGFGGFGFIDNKYNNFDYLHQKYSFEPNTLQHLKELYTECKRKNIAFPRKASKLNWLNNEFIRDIDSYKATVKTETEKSCIHKSKINKIYDDIFPDDIKLGKDFNNWRYNILLDKNSNALEKLFENGLFASKHYASLGEGYMSDDICRNAVNMQNKIINLFNDFHYSEEQAYNTAKIIMKCI